MKTLLIRKKNKRDSVLVNLGWWNKGKRKLSKVLLTFKRPMRLDGPVTYNIFMIMLGSGHVTDPS